MCDPVTATVAAVGIGAGVYAQERGRRDAKKAARKQEEAAERERQRIASGEAAIEEAFARPQLESQVEALAGQREAGQIDVAEQQYEALANKLDLQRARSGLAPGIGRDRLARQRLRRGLAKGRATAAVDAESVRRGLRSRLDASKRALLESVRGGAQAPGTESTIAGQTAMLQEAAANIPSQALVNVAGQTAGAIQTDTRARASGGRGIESLDFLDRR